MKIIKVFTKYDKLYNFINIPCTEDITVQPMSNALDCSPGGWKYKELSISKVEMGLEGVRFVTYEEIKKEGDPASVKPSLPERRGSAGVADVPAVLYYNRHL